MAEETESSLSKKRRIIHWNPDAGREQAARRWTWKRILGWSVGGFFALLFAAGIVIRVAKRVFGPDIFQPGIAQTAANAAPSESSMFISQTKAEQAREMTAKAMAEIRRLPRDHPEQINQMIFIETSFREGEVLLGNREFSKAFAAFDAASRDIDAYSKNVKAKGEAKQLYDTILVRIRDLEIARSLAPGSLEAALEEAGTGRKFLEDGNFTGAKKIFDDAKLELAKAEQALGEFVRQSLLDGQKALARGDKEGAKKAFQAALEKSQGNEHALQGLKRAETIDRVFALLQQGEKLEQQGQYAEASESYRKAFALDALSAVAQEGQSRAARLEKETKFGAAYAAADAAFKAREWPKAIAEFENALKVYPQKTDVQAKLKLAKESAHKDAVQKTLARGYAHENEHRWTEALDAYRQTLQLEPDLADAKEGLIRTSMVIRALLEYNRLVDVSEQLANKAEFQVAYRRFNDAMNSKPAYLEPSDRVLQLRALLAQQTQPVDVTFQSDGKTSVRVSGYKMLGQIQTETVKIVPGDYQIVGSRRGYKDVVRVLQVRNGNTPPLVTMVCNEAANR
ncbi:MAG: hypothetical protein ABIZ49_00740 [Opitutaceae bacterium]